VGVREEAGKGTLISMITPIDIALITVYVLIVLGIGFVSSRKQSPDDYMIHGRKLGTAQLVATISASWVGGGAIIAYGAYVFEYGIAAISVYVGFFCSMLVFARYAPRIRTRAAELGHLTIGDYITDSVGVRAGIVTALVSSVAYCLFLVNQFIAGSTVLSTLSGWTYETALVISVVVVLLYLLLGGMRSVVKTDIFQYLAMLILMVVIGGVMVQKTGIEKELLNPLSMEPGLAIAFILYGVMTPFASVEIWHRMYAAKDDTAVRRGLIGAGFFVMVFGCIIALLGMAARTAYPNVSPNEAIPYGMLHLLPAGLLGLGLVVLFAAIMSTIDTLVFYLASSIAKDYYGRKNPHISQKDLQRITRSSIVFVSILGALIAFFLRDILQVIMTVAGVISGMVPAIIGSFCTKLKENAVIASLISACLYVLLLIITDNIEPDYAVASLAVSAVVLVGWQKFGS
tara:strand:- start:10904 stop:12277 length:1374 start_codon:yes stop_codon:yes gene_type:complete